MIDYFLYLVMFRITIFTFKRLYYDSYTYESETINLVSPHAIDYIDRRYHMFCHVKKMTLKKR